MTISVGIAALTATGLQSLPSTRQSWRYGLWSTTVTSWSRLVPRRSTDCSSSSSPLAHPSVSARRPQPSCSTPSIPKPPSSGPCMRWPATRSARSAGSMSALPRLPRRSPPRWPASNTTRDSAARHRHVAGIYVPVRSCTRVRTATDQMVGSHVPSADQYPRRGDGRKSAYRRRDAMAPLLPPPPRRAPRPGQGRQGNGARAGSSG
jgi:hypothetical protein